MTNNEEYEKALNDSFNAYHNYPKDTYVQIPSGYSTAFNYGYTFGLQQATAEQKETSERQLNFQREHIAAAAMQGLLAGGYKAAYKDLAIAARACADALLNELKKPTDEHNQ